MGENQVISTEDTPTIQKVIAVMWPSFLVAGMETIVFFTLFDPQYVFMDYDVTRTGAYSIGFFLFWGFAILPCVLTMYFARPCKPCAVYKDELEPQDK
ncbi:MAG: hypothetical protein QNJ69_14235 [Gammaproteobacteria bacterium]|nr:hypothetical protein [Gammaproteobacteria bacterium]